MTVAEKQLQKAVSEKHLERIEFWQKEVEKEQMNKNSKKLKNFAKKVSTELKVKKLPKKIKGKTLSDFIEFLEGTLIPDLKESGSEYTAEDFQTCVRWMKFLVSFNTKV